MEERRTKKRTAPVLPRGFTPTRAQLDQALAVIRAGITGGMLPDVPTDRSAGSHAVGPGSLATGHGLANAGRKAEAAAYETFVEAVRVLVGPTTWNRLDVEVQAAWVRIVGKDGRVYIARSTTTVSRIESTLDPSQIPLVPAAPEGSQNASKPDRPNGSIKSWLRADVGVVAEAVKLIAGAEAMMD